MDLIQFGRSQWDQARQVPGAIPVRVAVFEVPRYNPDNPSHRDVSQSIVCVWERYAGTTRQERHALGDQTHRDQNMQHNRWFHVE